MYRHIVFDIDGTLIDTEEALMRALQDVVLRHQGRRMELSELRFSFGIPGKETMDQLGITDQQAAAAYWDERYAHYALGNIATFPGIAEALRALSRRGHVLGIITSRTRAEFMEVFTPFGLNELFTLVVCADDTEQHKPDPAPMLYYLKQMNASPEEVLYVGDTPYDMRCAHGAGARGALACWGAHDIEKHKADFYPLSPDELIPIAGGLIDPRVVTNKPQ